MPLLLALLSLVAFAGQSAFETTAGPREQRFHYVWTDAAGVRHVTDFSLPAADVARQLAEPVRLPVKRVAEAEVAGVRAYAKSVKGPSVKARARSDGQVSISVSGRDRGRVRAALEGAQAAGAAARAQWLDAHRWTTDRKGRIRPDHPRVAAESAGDVRPLAVALGMVGAAPREGLSTALAFVQSIRYEKKKRDGREAGFRRPLSLLAANKGDCDGKATLFLALARSAYPDLPVAIAYIPRHAFAAVALPPEKGDHTLRRDKVVYVLAEPVGPALAVLGDGSPRAKRRTALGLVEVVPVP